MSNLGYTLYVVDTETTTLDINGDIIEICLGKVVQDSSGKFQSEIKNWCIRAYNIPLISDEALKINGHKREDILWMTKEGRETYKERDVVVREIENWILDDDCSALDRIWVGHNAIFDIERTQELWKRCGRTKDEEFPFSLERNNRVIDTKEVVTLFDVANGRRRKAYGLQSLVKATHIKKGLAHTAEGDTQTTINLLIKLLSIIQEPIKEKFADCYLETEE